MQRWRAVYPLSLLLPLGCGETRPHSPPIIVGERERTVTVSGDDPFIDMQDGTRIGVDGVPAGQSLQFKLTQYQDSNGTLAVDVDAIPDPTAEVEQP